MAGDWGLRSGDGSIRLFFFFCREGEGDELVLLIILAGGSRGVDSCESKSAYGSQLIN